MQRCPLIDKEYIRNIEFKDRYRDECENSAIVDRENRWPMNIKCMHKTIIPDI